MSRSQTASNTYTAVTGLVEAQVRSRPGALAITASGKSITYAGLEALTATLMQNLRLANFGKGDIAAVCLEPSPEFIAAALAIMSLGGAYLPIDRNCPPERVAFLVSDSGARVFITASDIRGALHFPIQMPIIEEIGRAHV